MSLLEKFFPRAKTAEARELAQLLEKEYEDAKLRDDRRQWAIEQANYRCEDGTVDEVLRIAKRFYLEAFGEEWDE